MKCCEILNIKSKLTIKQEGKNNSKSTFKSPRSILSHNTFLVPQISNSLVQQPPHVDSARSGYNSEPDGSPVSWILDNPTVQVCGRIRLLTFTG